MDILTEYEDVALSNHDLIQMLNGQANIVTYPELINYNRIDDVLGPTGAAFILFETEPRYGHWVALMKRGNTIEYFDPYGGIIDGTLDYIPRDFQKQSNQDKTYLTKLLLDSPYEIEYNEFPFQKQGDKIKTCGRHSAVRLLLKDLDIYEYKDFLDIIRKQTGLDYDKIVTLLTS